MSEKCYLFNKKHANMLQNIADQRLIERTNKNETVNLIADTYYPLLVQLLQGQQN